MAHIYKIGVAIEFYYLNTVPIMPAKSEASKATGPKEAPKPESETETGEEKEGITNPTNDAKKTRRKQIIVVSVVVGSFAVWICYILFNQSVIIPSPEAYTENGGAAYAEELANCAQRLSFALLVIGWVFVLIGGFLAMCAALAGPVKADPEAATLLGLLKSQRGLMCSAFAIIFAGIGWQSLDRSSAASQCASVAVIAIGTASMDPRAFEQEKTPGQTLPAVDDGEQIEGESVSEVQGPYIATPDRRAYEACIKAKAAWIEGRMNHDRVLSIVNELEPQ